MRGGAVKNQPLIGSTGYFRQGNQVFSGVVVGVIAGHHAGGNHKGTVAWVAHESATETIPLDRLFPTYHEALKSDVVKLTNEPELRIEPPLVILGQGASQVTYSPCCRCHRCTVVSPSLYCAACIAGSHLDVAG